MVHWNDYGSTVLAEYSSEPSRLSRFHLLDHLIIFSETKSSALRIEQPAPPRTRLSPRATYFSPSRTGPVRRRPTLMDIPPPSSTSSRVGERACSALATMAR